ncbi:MAG: MOSC domain-containing protein [Maritimibacter sp.]
MAQAIIPTDYAGRITWLGRVDDSTTGLESAGLPELRLSFAGPEGEAHSGLTRAACARVTNLYERGTEIRNTRQVSILSAEELAEIAREMGVERVDPGWIGATLVVEGIPDLTHLPPSSRLQGPDGVTLVVDCENHPCVYAGKSVDAHLPGQGPKFKPAAKNRRGVTAWVEREGRLALGEELRLFIPAQRAWAP